MTCTPIPNGIVCTNNTYRFKGYYFEWHHFFGPSPLKKDGSIRQTIPKGFWEAISEFQKLSDTEKEKYSSE